MEATIRCTGSFLKLLRSVALHHANIITFQHNKLRDFESHKVECVQPQNMSQHIERAILANSWLSGIL